jgi:general L-amino acid transport system substrate-binding protein
LVIAVSSRWLGRAVAALLAVLPALQVAAGGPTVDLVRKRGQLVCGVGDGLTGLSVVDGRGQWSGLEVEFCHALAAAVIGRRDAVTFRPLSLAQRFAALRNGEVDVLMRASSQSLSRDTEADIQFVGPLLYDSQAMMVRRSQAVSSVLELSGATVCVERRSAAEQGVADFFAQRRMRLEAVGRERWEAVVQGYRDGGCQAIAANLLALAQARSRLAVPSDHVILPEALAHEPLGPMVRAADVRWVRVVRWTLNALIAAEQLGLTSQNIEAMRASNISEARRMLGVEGNLGALLGLDREWAFRVVRLVGSYGEIYDRSIGQRTALKLERGPNQLAGRGGLLHAPPFR